MNVTLDRVALLNNLDPADIGHGFSMATSGGAMVRAVVANSVASKNSGCGLRTGRRSHRASKRKPPANRGLRVIPWAGSRPGSPVRRS